MNELIRIEEKNGQQLVNARELHEFLEVTSRFNDWIRNRIEKYEFAENQDWCVTKNLVGTPSEFQPIDYVITTDMAKELCMVENNEKGRQARKYFIEAEKKFREPKVLDVYTPVELLELASKEIRAKDKVIEKQNKQIEKMQPAHDFVENVFLPCKTNIKIGDFAQVAAFPDPNRPKTILGQKKMFKLLRKLEILKSDNMPRTEFQNRGFFVIIEQVKEDFQKVFFTTYLTPLGQKWLYGRINDYLEYHLPTLQLVKK